MATFKAEVYAHQKKKDGTYNIKIRVTHNGEKRYLATPYFIYKEDITQKTFKIKNQHYIDLTDEMIRTYRKRLDRWGERQTSMTMEQIIRIITTDNENEKFDLDIAAYTWKEIKRMKEAGHGGNADTYICAVRSLVKFVGREVYQERVILEKQGMRSLYRRAICILWAHRPAPWIILHFCFR